MQRNVFAREGYLRYGRAFSIRAKGKPGTQTSSECELTRRIEYLGSELAAMSVARNYYAWILGYCRPHLGRVVLEHGGGIGSFSELLLSEAVDRLVVVEPAANLLPALRERLARWRRAPYAAGAALGIASLTKILPAVTLLPFLWRREWRALVAFTSVWAAALGLLLFFNPHALSAYYAANRAGSIEQIARLDNGALLIVAWRTGGLLALALAGALVGVVVAMGLRAGVTTTPAWAVWIWLGIALLPIAWVYSLLPLLPWLLRVLCQRRSAAQLAASLSIATALLSPAPGSNGSPVALSIAFAGVAFGLDARKSRTSDPDFWNGP